MTSDPVLSRLVTNCDDKVEASLRHLLVEKLTNTSQQAQYYGTSSGLPMPLLDVAGHSIGGTYLPSQVGAVKISASLGSKLEEDK